MVGAVLRCTTPGALTQGQSLVMDRREVNCSFHTESYRFFLKIMLTPSVTISMANASHCAMANFMGLEVKFSHIQKNNNKY